MSKLKIGWKRLLLVVTVGLALAVGGFVVCAATPSGSTMPEALAALNSDNQVTVTQDRWLVFTPSTTIPDTGFIIYPGGRVLANAYAPLAHSLAAKGYEVVIVSMPLNLAIFGVNAAQDVIAAYPSIQHWALGGHSLGGAMAANFVKSHPDVKIVQGLVFWAAYPQASDTLADRDELIVTSIHGSLDGLATVAKVEESRAYLPEETTFITIEGGNHAYFGWYGNQPGDNPATITRADQQQQVFAATLKVLRAISGKSTVSS
ncbi:MAG TPA: alpha/beta hydrolase [Phototrophicaceae bacterium]|jgi:hypothetical protein|nr:alpha/beta hydrolase [Phototrophicaceae bacterium]